MCDTSGNNILYLRCACACSVITRTDRQILQTQHRDPLERRDKGHQRGFRPASHFMDMERGSLGPKPNRMYVFQRMCLSRANVVQTSIITYTTSLYFAIYRSSHHWFQQLSPTSPPNSSVSFRPVARAPHGSDFHANSWNLLVGGKEISGAQQRTGV